MATQAQRIAALEQRIADLEGEIRRFRLDTILDVAGIAFSAGRDAHDSKYAAAAASRPRPRHLSVVGGGGEGR
jgi:hypothetical protein